MSQLALTMRPEKLEDVLGNESTKKALRSFAERGNWPNVLLFYGPPGTGKTSLVDIIKFEVNDDSAFIHEVNAADEGLVENSRNLIEKAFSSPLNGQRRVFVINEFQRMTSQAQECLLEPMEKTSAIWLLTSTDVSKIIPAIKSRASAGTFELKTLNRGQIADLVLKAAPSIASGTGVGVADFLWGHSVTSPREILGVLDQHLAGIPLEEAIHGSEHEPLFADVARAVLSGNWTKTSGLLEQIKTADSRAMVSVVSAFLRNSLIKETVGPRGDALATCVVGMDQTSFADGTAYAACVGLLYKCAKALGGK